MTTNTLLGLLFAATGIADVIIAQKLTDRLPSVARTSLIVFGGIFVLLGLTMVLGQLKLV